MGRRRWPRRTLIGANALVLLCLAAMASAYGYVEHEISSIATAPSPHLTKIGDTYGGPPMPTVDQSDGLNPENILLIGNETRQGLTPQQQLEYGSSLIYSGSLADIMMVLHLDPAKDTASILSIPRDLFSPMPAGSPVGPYQKMDAALNDGKEGPDNLAQAVQEDLGIPINHFIELNFNGFINSVNALGGIKVYFPWPVYDQESGLYIPNPGCHQLNGVQALALVRARHLQYAPPGDKQPRYDWPQESQSDLARIVRTHTFMKIVADTAVKEGKTDPLTAASFISAVVSQMTVDSGLKSQLLTLVLHYRHINPANIPETTLPTTPVSNYYYGGYGIGDVLFPVQPVDDNVIRAWDPQALPKAVRPTSVEVLSITGSSQAAVTAGQAFESEGLHVSSDTAGAVPAATSETLVLYHQGDVARALYVMKYLSGAVMMQQSSSVPAGTVTVDLGSTVRVEANAARATGGTTSTTASGSTGTAETTTTSATTTSATTTSATTTSASTASTGRTAGRTSTSTRAGTRAAHTTATTTVPTPGGLAPSSAADQQEPWDPRSCPAA